jgi:DNA-binding response OmpR family regulator
MQSRVLIIEDEVGTARPVKEALELIGISADIAVDGEVGIEMFMKDEYDLVLLDLKMPKMDGEEVLKKIREIKPYVYVIIYTNYSEFANIKALTNIGIDGYVNKGPDADLKELLMIIKGKLEPFSEYEARLLLNDMPEFPKDDKGEL